MQALNRYGGYRTTVLALKLMLLTFVRTVELRKAEWREFDLDGAEWRIPAGSGWLFPNYRNPQDCMIATTLNRALERMGFNGKDSISFSAHGFRATASTILNEMGYRPDVIERQLAHTERNKVRASYNRAEYLDERRKMIQVWADFVGNLRCK
ncbi:tyrosine-type recombinase/integrase [Pectobacterium brasiliense]|uniref:tyrosine-type recombinase/integrase n=1 Tax=Pectobacterium brasiliense TaxID=180957 RepID=UPI00068CC6F8|nr:site-specific integrase [Pectobacterium brasiliense]